MCTNIFAQSITNWIVYMYTFKHFLCRSYQGKQQRKQRFGNKYHLARKDKGHIVRSKEIGNSCRMLSTTSGWPSPLVQQEQKPAKAYISLQTPTQPTYGTLTLLSLIWINTPDGWHWVRLPHRQQIKNQCIMCLECIRPAGTTPSTFITHDEMYLLEPMTKRLIFFD
jgi:hypothetical protein